MKTLAIGFTVCVLLAGLLSRCDGVDSDNVALGFIAGQLGAAAARR